ncbi:hypothetical protein V491_03880, partial [Pseudogymnoascus sp. VKM F-3775]
GEEEHGPFGDGEGVRDVVFDDFEEEGAAVLVEPFGGAVDVVICAGIGAADNLVGRKLACVNGERGGSSGGRRGRGESAYHDSHVLVVDAVVVHGWLEEMGVLLKPGNGSHARSSLTTWAGSTVLGSLLLSCPQATCQLLVRSSIRKELLSESKLMVVMRHSNSVRSGDMPRADPITPRPGGHSTLAHGSSSLAVQGCTIIASRQDLYDNPTTWVSTSARLAPHSYSATTFDDEGIATRVKQQLPRPQDPKPPKMSHSMDHGGMDHGGHDASPARCNMNMLFTWSTQDLCIVFRSWHITGPITLILSLFAIVALVAAFEALRATTARYDAALLKRRDELPPTNFEGCATREGGEERAVCCADVLCVYDYAAVHDIQRTGYDCGGSRGFCGTPGVWRRDYSDKGDCLSLGEGRSGRLREWGRKEEVVKRWNVGGRSKGFRKEGAAEEETNSKGKSKETRTKGTADERSIRRERATNTVCCEHSILSSEAQLFTI